MKKNYIFVILLALCMVGHSARAQKVGIYTISAKFSNSTVSNQTRQLVFFADSSYSASKKYKLIVFLHGKGDNPLNVITQLKNMLTRSFGAAPGYNDVILVAPSEGSQDNFYQAEDNGIIEWCVTQAKAIYNVDPLFVYISGFSLGGRSGLQMGLNNYSPYRGLFLLTPAVQNMSEAQNQTAFKYAYQNGKFIPICMTVGGNDAQFKSPVTEAQKQLQTAGAKSRLTTIAGLGHNVPQTLNYYTDCYHFIEDNLNQAPQASFTADNTSGCGSLTVQFTDQSNRAATSWLWDFGDGSPTSTVQNPLHTYSNPGNYTVKLTATNTFGSSTNTKTSYINVGMGNAIAKIAKGGPVDSTFSTGGFFTGTNNERRLFFNVIKSAVVLKSVKVYANSAASRTIEILDRFGKTIKTATVSVPKGESRVTLNFTLAPDSNYAIKLAATSASDLYRTNGGKTSYPYLINGLVSIYNSDALVNNTKTAYYFFYDWEVGYQECDNSTGILQKSEYEGVSVFPNPSKGFFAITYSGKEEKTKVEIYNLMGSIVFTKEITIGNGKTEILDLSEQAKGTYFIKISGESAQVVRRIVVE